MKNEKFITTIDDAFKLMLSLHDLQMEQFKMEVLAIYEANTNEIDPKEIAEQIMDLPVGTTPTPAKPASEFKNYRTPEERLISAESERLYKIISKDPVVENGQFGDIWDLTRVQNASDTRQGFDFYHHCPEMQDDLVRLDYSEHRDEHMCQFCKQVFLSKYPPKGLSG